MMLPMNFFEQARPSAAALPRVRSAVMAAVLLALIASATPDAARSPGAPQAAPPASKIPSLEQQIRDASDALFAALGRRDLKAVETLLTDDFLSIQPLPQGAALVDKPTQLKLIRDVNQPRPNVERELTMVKVRSYGNVAVLTAFARYRGKAPNGAVLVATQSVISEIWVTSGGGWRLAHMQPTLVGQSTSPK